jgi:hypothetical protein
MTYPLEDPHKHGRWQAALETSEYGAPWTEIAARFDVSVERVHQLVRRAEKQLHLLYTR